MPCAQKLHECIYPGMHHAIPQVIIQWQTLTMLKKYIPWSILYKIWVFKVTFNFSESSTIWDLTPRLGCSGRIKAFHISPGWDCWSWNVVKWGRGYRRHRQCSCKHKTRVWDHMHYNTGGITRPCQSMAQINIACIKKKKHNITKKTKISSTNLSSITMYYKISDGRNYSLLTITDTACDIKAKVVFAQQNSKHHGLKCFANHMG